MLFDLIRKKKFDKLLEYIKTNENLDLDVYDEHVNYFIHYLILFNNIKIVSFIIKNRRIRLDILDADGRNLLYHPIRYNYYEILEQLVEHDSKNIGISILNTRDNKGNTGIHYAVIFNNFPAFKLLYKHNADLNIIDNDNRNVYTLCLEYNRNNMLIYLLESDNQKSAKYYVNHIGESILQTAINSNNTDIIDYIINSNILDNIINNQEHEHGLSALHQCVILGFNNIVIKLIEKGANVNICDYLGNTSLHYSIIDKNYMILEYLINIKDIYTNEININGNTALHLLLEEDFINLSIANESKHMDNLYLILIKLIELTELNIMNNNGNTCLYYIVKKKLWKLDKIKNILKMKSMNLFIVNKNNEKIYDMINSDEFIDIVIDSYYNILKMNKHSVILWEHYCANDNLNKLLQLTHKKGDIKVQCKELIKHEITKMNRSMPFKREIKLKIDNGIYTEDGFYTGTTIDILFGLIYLHTNFKNVNLILDYPLGHNKEIEEHYTKMGRDIHHDFLNIEIIWSFMKLFYPTSFNKIILNNISSGYTIIPIGIEISIGFHANIIIINNDNKMIERFEPNGKNPPRGFHYNPELLDKMLKDKFMELLPQYKYRTPKEYLPTIGLQLLEHPDSRKLGDPNGFCAVWCIWWVEQVVSNSSVESVELMDGLIKHIKFSGQSFKKIIRSYSMKIVKYRDKFLEKYKITIDDWVTGNYNKKKIDALEHDIFALEIL